MLPKKQYMALSKADRARVRASVAAGGPGRRMVSGQGAYKQRMKRNAIPRVRGKGGYAADIGGALGGALGGLIPIPGGSAVGKWAGSKLGGYIGKIFGKGAYSMPNYSVRKNSFLDEGQPVPQFGGSDHGTIVCHREYLQDISGSTSFSIANYPINPGQAGTFPWLSTVAANYEEYVMEGLIFEFISTSADALNSTNTALGTVMMATEYNAANANFVNKQQMLEYEFATSGRPSVSQCHIVECARRETVLSELYVRTGTVPSGQDQRMFDLGNFQIATTGMQAAAVIGELWCSYKVRLLKPRLFAGPFGGSIGWANYSSTSGISTSAYFGTSPAASTGSNLALTLGTSTITFPSTLVEGYFQLTYYVVGGSVTPSNPTVTFTSGCTGISAYAGSTTVMADGDGTAGTNFVYVKGFQITAASAVITFTGGTLPSSPTLMILLIQQTPSSVP